MPNIGDKRTLNGRTQTWTGEYWRTGTTTGPTSQDGAAPKKAVTANGFPTLPTLTFTDTAGNKRELQLDIDSILNKFTDPQYLWGQLHTAQSMYDRLLPPDIGKDPREDYAFAKGVNYEAFDDPELAKVVLDQFMTPVQQLWGQISSKVSVNDMRAKGFTAFDQVPQLANSFYQEYNRNNATTEAMQNLTKYEQATASNPGVTYSQAISGGTSGTGAGGTASTKTLLDQYKEKYPDLAGNSTALYNKARADYPDLKYADFTSKTTAAGTGGAGEFEISGDFGSDDSDFAEFLTYQEYLDNLPDQGSSIIQQWEDLATQQIGDDYTKIKDQIDKAFGLFQEGQQLESSLSAEEKAVSERYIQEDLDRYLAYSNEDRTKGLTQIDTGFAKALSSAASGYLDLGIRLGSGSLRREAAGIREDVSIQRDTLNTAAERGAESAMTDAQRNREQLNMGYEAFRKRQELEAKQKTQSTDQAKDELDIEAKRKKAELVAIQRGEARSVYTSNQLKSY